MQFVINSFCVPHLIRNSGVKVTITCPCTEKHIQKYSTQTIHIVQETPDIYSTITEPRLELQKEQFSLDVSTKWKHEFQANDYNKY